MRDSRRLAGGGSNAEKTPGFADGVASLEGFPDPDVVPSGSVSAAADMMFSAGHAPIGLSMVRAPALARCLSITPIRRSVEEAIMTMKYASARALAVGALIAMGAAGCAHEPATYSGNKQERSATQSASDATLSARIKTAFATDSLVKARDIKVDSMRGVVTLSGTVNSGAEREKAIAIARDTKGVVEVKSNLKLAG
jgi:hyperosmotically inducible protein